MQDVLPLNDTAIQTFYDMQRYHPSRRARLRAPSLLLRHQGLSSPHMARIYPVDRRRVSSWIDRWQTPGFVGVYDHPGAGRRPTWSADEQQKVRQSLHQSPTDLNQGVQQLEQDTTTRGRTKPSKRFIKKSRDVGQRLRTSPATFPHPQTSARSTE